jgi:hypothetical protein
LHFLPLACERLPVELFGHPINSIALYLKKQKLKKYNNLLIGLFAVPAVGFVELAVAGPQKFRITKLN